MDKKSWTRILIVIVAGLWAYNIYRTVENYQITAESQEHAENQPLTFAPVLFNKDTFNLFLSSTDPFLKNQKFRAGGEDPIGAQTIQHSSGSNQPAQTPPPQIQKISWPKISYFGFLKNLDENHQLCMININGKKFRMRAGETKEGIQIVTAYPDSIRLAFQNEFKTVLK